MERKGKTERKGRYRERMGLKGKSKGKKGGEEERKMEGSERERN